jgi:hypothetical protein
LEMYGETSAGVEGGSHTANQWVKAISRSRLEGTKT